MFKTIYNKVKQYAGLVDDFILDFIGDLKSFRVQLVYWALIMNFGTMYLVSFHGVDYKAFVCSFGAVTICYAFYFASKAKQSELEANASPTEVSGDPTSNFKDPDDI
jgi:hypothetical protein